METDVIIRYQKIAQLEIEQILMNLEMLTERKVKSVSINDREIKEYEIKVEILLTF